MLLQLPIISIVSYLAIKNGMSVFYGVAMAASLISLVLNLICEVKYGKKD